MKVTIPEFCFKGQKEYLHELDDVKKASKRALIWMDDKGHIHCAGLFKQMLFKAEAFFSSLIGRVAPVRSRVTEAVLKQFLVSGVEKQWIKVNESKGVLSAFNAYNKEHDGYIQKSNFYDLFLKFGLDTVHIPKNKKINAEKIFATDEDIAATKIAAAWRGWKTRQAAVQPSQIKEQLQRLLLDDIKGSVDLNAMALALCREINAISLEGNLRKGEGYKLKAGSVTYSLPVFEGTTWKRTEKVQLLFDCWVSLSDDGKSVDILFKANDKEGQGTYKEVFKAQDFKFHLRLNPGSTVPKRRVEYEPAVVFTAKSPEDNDTILLGLKVIEELAQVASGNLVDSPVYPVKTSVSGALEMRQTWYNSDWHKAARAGSVALDIRPNSPRRVFSNEDTVRVAMDVSEVLVKLHESGMVHRDVKGPNILVKVQKDGVCNGYLSDFDLVTTFGDTQEITADYQYWDRSGRHGWPLPLIDCYGLAITFAEETVPEFHVIRDTPSLLSSATIDSYKAAAFKAKLPRAIYDQDAALYGELKLLATKEELLKRIDEALGQNPTDQLLDALVAYKKDVVVVDFALSTALNLIQDSNTVYDYLNRHPLLRNQLITSPGSLTSISKKRRRDEAKLLRQMAADEVLLQTRYTTAEELRKSFTALQQELICQYLGDA